MLTLGKKTLSVPILQGGLGVGVSLGGLAGAVAACGVTAVLAEKGVQPAYTAGLSLGEYSALEAAGVFTAKQAIEQIGRAHV